MLVYVDDDPAAEISEYFTACSEFIDEALSRPHSQVLVHCMAGHSRSATVLAAHLMRTEGLTATAAVGVVAAVRPKINPNPGFMAQLSAYEATMSGPPTAAAERTPTHRSSGSSSSGSIPVWWLPGGLHRKDEIDGLDELLSAPGTQIVDVRWTHEYARHRLVGARLCPVLPGLISFERRLKALGLSLTAPTVVVCEHAIRSPLGVKKLRAMGFTDVRHLRGGMSRWIHEPGVPLEVGD